jgi:hypothetical protein
MNLLRALLGAAAAATIVLAFRDPRTGEWIVPSLDALTGRAPETTGEEEPFLGYDGMDRDTLIGWLDDAGPDRDTLVRIRAYERAHRARESVLEAVEDLLD